MQFLVVIQTKEQYVGGEPPPEFKKQHPQELKVGQQQYAKGQLRQSWEIDSDRHGAVCLYEAASREALQPLIDAYPHVQSGFADYQVFPLKFDGAYTQGV